MVIVKSREWKEMGKKQKGTTFFYQMKKKKSRAREPKGLSIAESLNLHNPPLTGFQHCRSDSQQKAESTWGQKDKALALNMVNPGSLPTIPTILYGPPRTFRTNS